jgi:hypothetical protein
MHLSPTATNRTARQADRVRRLRDCRGHARGCGLRQREPRHLQGLRAPCEMEPDQTRGWCEHCGINTVLAAPVLAGIM